MVSIVQSMIPSQYRADRGHLLRKDDVYEIQLRFSPLNYVYIRVLYSVHCTVHCIYVRTISHQGQEPKRLIGNNDGG